jgi:hypothetical protein
VNHDVPDSLQYGRTNMRIVYSRDFLLSFGELEHCKKLPPSVDIALLRSSRDVQVYFFRFFWLPASFECPAFFRDLSSFGRSIGDDCYGFE